MKPRKSVRDQPQSARLSGVVNWAQFDGIFSLLYVDDFGWPAIPTGLMVGLRYLKHLCQLGDENVVQQWVENLYCQYLCGSRYFEHKLPIHPTSMTRWRQKITAGGAEALLTETLVAGLQTKLIRPHSLQRVVVDTTVQEKAVAYPTDGKLYDDMRSLPARVVEKSKLRCAAELFTLREVGADRVGAKRITKGRKHTKKLNTYLGRALRESERKLDPEQLNERRTDPIAPSFDAPHSGRVYWASRRHMGQGIGGESDVDRGCKGHNYTGPAKVVIAKTKRKQEPKVRRWRRKRNRIEAAINHMKNDGWPGRNHLKGVIGNRVNALLVAWGQNLRKLLGWLARCPAGAFCAQRRPRLDALARV